MGVGIKICGLTNVEDARAATELGVDWVGFIFARQSPRFVEAAEVYRIVSRLPAGVAKVGVFVDTPAPEIGIIMQQCGLDIAQLHGDEDEAVASALGPERVWKAFAVRTRAELQGALAYPAEAVLVDTVLPGQRGGTGRVGNWELAAELARERRVLLAGGLRPGNVAEAIRTVRPYGVDVGSGVEARPGKKDMERLRAFVAAARAAAPGK